VADQIGAVGLRQDIFQVLRAEGDTILSVLIQSDLIWSSENSIAETGAPAVATFTGVNFTGRFEYQLIKK